MESRSSSSESNPLPSRPVGLFVAVLTAVAHGFARVAPFLALREQSHLRHVVVSCLGRGGTGTRAEQPQTL